MTVVHKRVIQLANAPVWKFLDARAVKAQDGLSVVELPIEDHIKQMYGAVHGGLIATVVDMAMAAAVTTTLDEDEYATTIDLQVSYLRPALDGVLIGKGEVIKRGKRIAFLDTKIYNDQHQLVAKGSGSFMILDKKNK